MSKRTEAARAALTTIPMLHSGFHQPIIDALHAAGVLEDNGDVIHATAKGGLSRIRRVEAEAESNTQVRQALRYAGHKLAQCGVEFTDVVDHERGEISIAKLNAAMEGKPVDFRIAVKNALSVAGAID